MRTPAGFTLIDTLVVTAVVSLGLLLAVPPLLRAAGKARVGLAAAEVTGALRQARLLAARRSAHVGLRFESLGGGRFGYAVYGDGDGDGVRSDDIARGTDPLLLSRRRLDGLGRGVGFGFPPGIVPRDPADPGRRLDRLGDPIRFNRSDIASFSPLDGATPGSVYVTDGEHHLFAVRLNNRTARVHLLRWDRATGRWE